MNQIFENDKTIYIPQEINQYLKSKGIENYFSFFCLIPCKNLDSLLHAPCILVRKKLEKRLCLTGTRGHPVIITKNTPKKGTKKAETLKLFEHFDYLLIGVTGFEPAASWSRMEQMAAHL